MRFVKLMYYLNRPSRLQPGERNIKDKNVCAYASNLDVLRVNEFYLNSSFCGRIEIRKKIITVQ